MPSCWPGHHGVYRGDYRGAWFRVMVNRGLGASSKTPSFPLAPFPFRPGRYPTWSIGRAARRIREPPQSPEKVPICRLLRGYDWAISGLCWLNRVAFLNHQGHFVRRVPKCLAQLPALQRQTSLNGLKGPLLGLSKVLPFGSTGRWHKGKRSPGW